MAEMTADNWTDPGHYYVEWVDPSMPLVRPCWGVDAKTPEDALNYARDYQRAHHPGMRPLEWIVKGPYQRRTPLGNLVDDEKDTLDV